MNWFHSHFVGSISQRTVLIGYPAIARQHVDDTSNISIILHTPDSIVLEGVISAVQVFLQTTTQQLALQVWRPMGRSSQFELRYSVVSLLKML